MRIALAFAILTFEVASVKPSARQVGPDDNNQIKVGPASVSARNATLKGLIAEAYALQPFQILGGPTWLNSNEYDLDARAAAPSDKAALRQMLQSLPTDRFHLHKESRDQQVYELTVLKTGPKPSPTGRTLSQFAEFLSIQLSIPISNDPTKPARAAGPPIPVLDRTGLAGTYDLNVNFKLEPGADSFTLWQRALQDQLGLKLVSRKAPVEVLIVDGAAPPTAN